MVHSGSDGYAGVITHLLSLKCDGTPSFFAPPTCLEVEGASVDGVNGT
jgi:hypothetical protein